MHYKRERAVYNAQIEQRIQASFVVLYDWMRTYHDIHIDAKMDKEDFSASTAERFRMLSINMIGRAEALVKYEHSIVLVTLRNLMIDAPDTFIAFYPEISNNIQALMMRAEINPEVDAERFSKSFKSLEEVLERATSTLMAD